MKDKQLISEITLDLSAPVEARLPRAADELVLADALQAYVQVRVTEPLTSSSSTLRISGGIKGVHQRVRPRAARGLTDSIDGGADVT